MTKISDIIRMLLILDPASVVEMMELCQFGQKASCHPRGHPADGPAPPVEEKTFSIIFDKCEENPSEMLCSKFTLN